MQSKSNTTVVDLYYILYYLYNIYIINIILFIGTRFECTTLGIISIMNFGTYYFLRTIKVQMSPAVFITWTAADVCTGISVCQRTCDGCRFRRL